MSEVIVQFDQRLRGDYFISLASPIELGDDQSVPFDLALEALGLPISNYEETLSLGQMPNATVYSVREYRNMISADRLFEIITHMKLSDKPYHIEKHWTRKLLQGVTIGKS